MDDRTKLAFEFAQETVKQMITLSTGVVALTVTFAKDFLTHVPAEARWLVLLSWVCFLASVFFGWWALAALTGSLGSTAKVPTLDVYRANIAIPSFLQAIAFIAGLISSVTFALSATPG